MAEDWKKPDKKTYKSIILNKYEQILELGSKEFIGGYTNKSINTNGFVVSEVYVPDARTEYCQLIKVLSISLKWLAKPKHLKAYTSYEEQVVALKKKYANAEGFLPLDTEGNNRAKYSVELVEASNTFFEELTNLMADSDMQFFKEENKEYKTKQTKKEEPKKLEIEMDPEEGVTE